MTSVDEEHGERQDDEDYEYEYVHVNGGIFDTIEAASRLQEAVTQLGGAQRLQQHLAVADRLARGPMYEVQRQLQQMQDFIDPPWQRRLREQEAMLRRAAGYAPYGRWVRVQRTRRREDPPPPSARKVEPEPEPRKGRGRPRKGSVEHLALFVREYRQRCYGANPTKWHTADRLRVGETTIDDWLRNTPYRNWKAFLAALQ